MLQLRQHHLWFASLSLVLICVTAQKLAAQTSNQVIRLREGENLQLQQQFDQALIANPRVAWVEDNGRLQALLAGNTVIHLLHQGNIIETYWCIVEPDLSRPTQIARASTFERPSHTPYFLYDLRSGLYGRRGQKSKLASWRQRMLYHQPVAEGYLEIDESITKTPGEDWQHLLGEARYADAYNQINVGDVVSPLPVWLGGDLIRGGAIQRRQGRLTFIAAGGSAWSDQEIWQGPLAHYGGALRMALTNESYVEAALAGFDRSIEQNFAEPMQDAIVAYAGGLFGQQQGQGGEIRLGVANLGDYELHSQFWRRGNRLDWQAAATHQQGSLLQPGLNITDNSTTLAAQTGFFWTTRQRSSTGLDSSFSSTGTRLNLAMAHNSRIGANSGLSVSATRGLVVAKNERVPWSLGSSATYSNIANLAVYAGLSQTSTPNTAMLFLSGANADIDAASFLRLHSGISWRQPLDPDDPLVEPQQLDVVAGGTLAAFFGGLDANIAYVRSIETQTALLRPTVQISVYPLEHHRLGANFASEHHLSRGTVTWAAQFSYTLSVDAWTLTGGIFETFERGDIRGRVYEDVNANSLYDRGIDKPFTGAVLIIDDHIQVTTNQDGEYFVSNLRAGLHQIQIQRDSYPERSRLTTPPAQTFLVDGVVPSVDFGFTRSATIYLIFINDLNLNGHVDHGEPGVPGVQINLTGPGGKYQGSSSFDGLVQIAGVIPGHYTLEWDARSLPPDYTVTSGATTTFDVTELELKNIAISLAANRGVKVFVFRDRNKNGVYDNNESVVRGAAIELAGKRSSTDEQGRALLRNLPAGQYELRVTATNQQTVLSVFLPTEPSLANYEIALP